MISKKNLSVIDAQIEVSKWLGISAVVGAIVSTLWPLSIDHGYTFNEYGDYLGGVGGTIISFGTAAFLYMTYQSQRKELLIQQNELEQQKIDRQTERNDRETEKAQAKREILLQQMDERFFKVLTLHNEAVLSLDIRTDGNNTAHGKDCLKYMYTKLQTTVKTKNAQKMERVNAGKIDLINETEMGDILIEDIFKVFLNDVDVYFKSVLNVCRHLYKIDNNKIELTDYTILFRSQLSVAELCIIHYVTKSTMKTPNQAFVADYVNRFGLLFDLTKGDLIKYEPDFNE